MGFWDEVFGVLFTPSPEPFDELRKGCRALLRGHILPRDLLYSPFGNLPCVYYHAAIFEWRSTGVFGEGFWQIVEQDECITEFYLQQGAHRVLVAPFAARVEPGKAHAIEHPLVVGPLRRAQEFVLRPGGEILVQGQVEVVHDVHDEERAYREPTRRFMIRASHRQELLIQPVTRALHGDVVRKSLFDKLDPGADSGRQMPPARNDHADAAGRRSRAR